MPKKKVKKKSKRKLETVKEKIYKTRKEWISKAVVNKSQYEKKYNKTIKDNNGYRKKEGKRNK